MLGISDTKLRVDYSTDRILGKQTSIYTYTYILNLRMVLELKKCNLLSVFNTLKIIL